MNCPKHFKRYPTQQAIDSLARRFNLRNDPYMQDWEYEVADSSRISEFLSAYKSGELSEDERFTLMETLIQSFEDSKMDLSSALEWKETLGLIDRNIELHAATVWYWSDPNDEWVDHWEVTAFLRELFEKHKVYLTSDMPK
jgi:hypothetical protein